MAVKYYKDGKWQIFPGTVGAPGKDAYQMAVDNGYTGTLKEFIQALLLLPTMDARISDNVDAIKLLSAQRLRFEIVEELPTNPDLLTIYLVKNNKDTHDTFDEYLFVNGDWELIGTTKIDLSNYYSKSEVDDLINNSIPEFKISTTGSGNVIVNVNELEDHSIQFDKSLSVYSKSEVDSSIKSIRDDINSELDLKANVDNVYSKNEADIIISNLENKISKAVTSVESGSQDYLNVKTDDNVATVNLKLGNLGSENGLLESQSTFEFLNSTYYNKQESDSKFQVKGNYITEIPSEYITEENLKSKNYATVSNVQNSIKEAVNSIDFSDYYTKNDSDAKFQLKGEYLTTIPSDYITETELAGSLNNYALKTEIPTDFYTKAEIDKKIDDVESGHADLSNYYTKIDSDSRYQEKGDYLTSIPDEYVTDSMLSQYASLAWVSSNYQPVGNYITGIPEEYITENELTTVLTNKDFATKSDLNTTVANYYTKSQIDDKGYLTSIPSEYITESELNDKLNDITTGDVDLTGYATEEWVENQKYLTTIPSEYIKGSEVTTLLSNYVQSSNVATINNQSLLSGGNINISEGTFDYTELNNKAKVNGVELVGEISLSELGVQPSGSYVTTDNLQSTVESLDSKYLSTNGGTVGELNLTGNITGQSSDISVNSVDVEYLKIHGVELADIFAYKSHRYTSKPDSVEGGVYDLSNISDTSITISSHKLSAEENYSLIVVPYNCVINFSGSMFVKSYTSEEFESGYKAYGLAYINDNLILVNVQNYK